MGVVYLARHKVIGKKVAIKILRADLAQDNATTERFLQEAKAASSIGNPHIIDISDFGGLPDGSTYIVMEWLDGQPLTRVLEETNPLPVTRAVHIAKQISVALAAAHAQGIVHRDLKPDNIFLIRHGDERDFVKILDFGVAKVASAGAKLTRAGSVVGTPLYMSPEQAAGAPVDARTDIYALGVILYEIVSGRVPFDAENIMGILTQHMYKAPTRFSDLDRPPPDIPAGLEAVILKALSKKPEHRYQTMDGLTQDLDEVARGAIPSAVSEMIARSGGFNVPADFFKKVARVESVPDDVPAFRGKTRWGMYVGIAAALAATGLIALTSSTGGREVRPPSPVAMPPPAPVEPVAATPPPEPKRVLLASEPLDAHFFQSGQDLGSPPLALNVPDGQLVTLEVRREGFKAQTITLDGSEKSYTIRLVKVPSARPAPAKREVPRPLRPPSIGGGEIVNPWAK
jgi:serine/threonine protein kinase